MEIWPCELERADGWMGCPYEILSQHGTYYPDCAMCRPVLIIPDELEDDLGD